MAFKITFGTDGWRGVIAEDYTFDNVRRCAQGFATYLLKQGKQGQWVVVGHDKRFSSEHFAAAVAEVLAGNGLEGLSDRRRDPHPGHRLRGGGQESRGRGQHHRQSQPAHG